MRTDLRPHRLISYNDAIIRARPAVQDPGTPEEAEAAEQPSPAGLQHVQMVLNDRDDVACGRSQRWHVAAARIALVELERLLVRLDLHVAEDHVELPRRSRLYLLKHRRVFWAQCRGGAAIPADWAAAISCCVLFV
nr:hypothetical protein [Sphingomonas daechungensis]